jgi:putative ABC transport system permease protein
MKRTRLVDLLANIRKTWVSFFSIVMFVALGVCIFLGIRWSAMALDAAADRTYEAQQFHDFDIAYPYGITQQDLADMKSTDGVEKAEGSYTAYETFSLDGQGHVATVISTPETIDQPVCLEGTLPQAADEVAVDGVFADKMGLGIGDTITFDPDDTSAADGSKYLNGRTFRVSALVSSPCYESVTLSSRGTTNLSVGSADCFLILPESAFDTTTYDGCYSNALVRCSATSGISSFVTGYTTASDAMLDKLEELGKTSSAARYAAFTGKAQAQIDDAQAQIDDGQAKIDSSEQEIADGEQTIAEKEQEISSGEQTIAEKEQEISDGQAQADDAETTLADKLDQINQAESTLGDKEAQVNSSIDSAANSIKAKDVTNSLGSAENVANLLRSVLDEAAASGKSASEVARSKGIPDALVSTFSSQAESALAQYKQYLSARSQLESGIEEYNSARTTLNEKEQELADGKATIAQKKQEIADGKATIEQKKQEIADGKATIEQKKAELENAKETLAQKKDTFAQAKDSGWIVQNRHANAGYAQISSFADVTDRLRLSMASLFLLVGLLVCYTAVSRIVKEQVVTIGTKKALGLRSGEITTSFLAYAGLAVIIGIIAGALLAILIVEGVLNGAAQSQFSFGSYGPYASIVDVLQIGAVELALILLSAWFACRKMLKKQAIQLLKGEEPPSSKQHFYERLRIWNKLPVLSQSIVNNFFNDKLRVLGTVVGVMGCTALVVSATTMLIDVEKTFQDQYTEVYTYTYSIVTRDATAEDLAAMEQTINDAGANAALYRREFYLVRKPDGSTSPIEVSVPDNNASFDENLHTQDEELRQEYDEELSSNALVSSGFVKHLGSLYRLNVHDPNAELNVDVYTTDNTSHDISVLTVFPWRLTRHEFVMRKDYYESVFGVTYAPNTILITNNGADKEQLISQLRQMKGFFSVKEDYIDDKAQFDSLTSITRTLVILYIALSALMALVVLLNQSIMFIEEKKRDLIVLMINGFSLRDAKRYIYLDSIVLTIIGIVIGIVVGSVMGYLSIQSIEFEMDDYIADPSVIACLAGVASTAFFAVLVNLIALRRIGKFKLTDINKV